VGIVAPWVAAREIAEGSLKLVPIDGVGIEREWGVFHSPKREPSLVEEAFIGMCEMSFAAMPVVGERKQRGRSRSTGAAGGD